MLTEIKALNKISYLMGKYKKHGLKICSRFLKFDSIIFETGANTRLADIGSIVRLCEMENNIYSSFINTNRKEIKRIYNISVVRIDDLIKC